MGTTLEGELVPYDEDMCFSGDTPQPEHEIPDMAAVLQHFLNPESKQEPTLSACVQTTNPDCESVHTQTGDPEPDCRTESVIRTLKRINHMALESVNLMTVPVAFHANSKLYGALLDTGAEVNIISSQIVKDLELDAKPTGMVLKGLGKQSHSTLGEVSLTLSVHGRCFPLTSFIVVPDGTVCEPVVLGYNFLKSNAVMIDCARNRLSIAGSSGDCLWELYVPEKGQKCQQILYGYNVCTAESVTLSDSHPTSVPVTIKYPSDLDLNFICPHCDTEKPPEMFYDGQISNEGLSQKVTGVPGILPLQKSTSVLLKGLTSNNTLKKGEVVGRVFTMLVVDPPLSCNSVFTEGDSKHHPTLQAISEIPLAADISPEQQEEFRSMVRDHLPVISSSDDDVGACSTIPIRIQLYEETPIYQRVRRFSPPITEAIELQCKELHDLGIIEPSISPWSSPVVPVIKPDKSLRLCVDYRKLNKVTIPDRFPMPNLSDSVFSLHGIKYFTSLDLVRGYYQLPLDKDSKELTAFSTAYGHWQFKRLSFGLKNAPAVFQREMQRILHEFPKCHVIVYIDDILILGRNFKEHLRLVERVLSVLQKHGLKIKLSKCSWFQPEVKFLGHLVSRNGLAKLPDYVRKVAEFPKPVTVREMRGFLGLVNFQRKFVPNCSTLSKPLSAVTGGKKCLGSRKIIWTSEMDSAFERIKEVISEEIRLSFPDYSIDAEPLELFVDASGDGAGACLCQQQREDRVVIAYDSMTFLDSETRYSTIERELAALRWGIKTFRPFLYGQFFIVHSDHRPLMYLHNMKMIDSRLSRTLDELSEFDFIVKYYPGSQNTAADWLSRIPGGSRDIFVSEDHAKLPTGLRVYHEVPGGPGSLFEALRSCITLQLEESGDNSVPDLSEGKLRQQMVDRFLKDSTRLGFKLTRASKNSIRAMQYLGCVPALELLLAASRLFNLVIWVHFGASCPVVFQDPKVENPSRIHVQCLAGVHYNPIIELKNFIPSSEVVSGTKICQEKLVPDVQIQEDLTETPVVQYSAEVSPLTLSCFHENNHGSQCIVLVENTPCCALLDTGAEVSLVSMSVLDKLGYNPEVCSEGEILGVAHERSGILGTWTATIALSSNWKFPAFSFAVVPSECLDFCFIVGRNLLQRAQLVLDYLSNSVIFNTVCVGKLGISTHDEKVTGELTVMSVHVNSDHCENPSITALISIDVLREIQSGHRVLKHITTLVLNGTPKHVLPHSYRMYRSVWASLEVVYDLLWKRESDGKLVFVVPFSFLIDMSTQLHLTNTHIGIFKLTSMLKRLIWHHSLKKVVRDVCRTCSVCQKCKVSSRAVLPPTLRINTSSPFELLAMDLVNLPITSTGYIGCLMVVDHFSKWVTAVPIRNKQSRTICKCLEANVLPTLPRVPVRILTDNGPEFISEEFGALLDRFNIVHVRTTPYKPSSNGAVERVNRTIGELLRVLTEEARKWDEYLPQALLTYNHTVHSEIGCTPAEKILKVSYDIDSLPVLSAEIRHPWADGNPRYQPFVKGMLVLRKTILSGNLTSNKFQPRFDGPYQVLKVFSNRVTYELLRVEDGQLIKAHHTQLKVWYEPPSYLKRHFKFRSEVTNVDQISENSLAVQPSESPNLPTVNESNSDTDPEESSDSSSEGPMDNLPIEVFQYLCKASSSKKARKHKCKVSSILKPSRTYERKQSLKMWERLPDEPDLTAIMQPEIIESDWWKMTDQDSTSVLEPDVCFISIPFDTDFLPDFPDFHTLSNQDMTYSYVLTPQLTDSPMISPICSGDSEVFDSAPEISVKAVSSFIDDQVKSLEDWDVSPINSFDEDQNSIYLNCPTTFVPPIFSSPQRTLLPQSTNSFKNSDGSLKTLSQLQQEVSQEPNGNISANFSGFDDQPAGKVSAFNISQTCRALRNAINKLRRLSGSFSVSGEKMDLSPAISDLQRARQVTEQARRVQRAKVVSQKRNLSYSPPLTRSRGKAKLFPNVQPKTLERTLVHFKNTY